MHAEVQEVQQLSPSMRRVILAGGTLDQFEPSAFTDSYINASFVPAASPLAVPFDPADAKRLQDELQPRSRRYTVRRWDAEEKALWIDFAVHGDLGYAGSWAQRAKPGDRLQFKGPGGSYSPSPDVEWHLLAGDESAFGAIGASLESLGSSARAHVFLVADGPEHQIEFPSEASVTVKWLYRGDAANPETQLTEAIAGAAFPAGSYDVFVHGEADEIRAVSRHLRTERGFDVSSGSISPYWRRGHTDEEWRAVKRQWMKEAGRA